MANDGLGNDQYVKQWLSGLSETTTKLPQTVCSMVYLLRHDPSQKIKKRLHDLATEDLNERMSFEGKFG